MALMKQWVMITVVYDDEQAGPPCEWDWQTLLELKREAGEFIAPITEENYGSVIPWSGIPPNPYQAELDAAKPEPEPEPEDNPCRCSDCLLERGEYPCDGCGDELGHRAANSHNGEYLCDDCYENREE